MVTNDRYRDWAERFPDIRSPGFLVRGGYRKGRPSWLDLDAEPEAAHSRPPDTRTRPDWSRAGATRPPRTARPAITFTRWAR